MFDRILVVCDGNICRSPTAQIMLAVSRPEKSVSSAGLVGLEGADMAAQAREIAEQAGLHCPQHVARRITGDMCRGSDLILVMEARQKEKISMRFPEASGKTFLLTHWNGRYDIPDPYKRSRDVYQQVFTMMNEACQYWAKKL